MAHGAEQRGSDDRAGNQLKTDRRSIDRPRDAFGGFALLLVVAALAAVYFLQRHRENPPAVAADAPASAGAAATAPSPSRPYAASEQALPPAAAQAQDCGYVNGERRCFARSVASDEGPSAADRYARAIRIMQSNPASTGSAVPDDDDPYRGNHALRFAEQVCTRWLPQHLIEYRHCRAEQWQKLRSHCIAARQELQMASGHRYDALKRSAEEYCSAEQRYQIVDRR